MRKINAILLFNLLICALNLSAQVDKFDCKGVTFSGDFCIYYSARDPQMALRPSEIPAVQYNVITWVDENLKEGMGTVYRKREQGGDGFDDSILDGALEKRTADMFALSYATFVSPKHSRPLSDGIEFIYEETENWRFSAAVDSLSSQYPKLTYRLEPKVDGYFSVVYTGAPRYEWGNTTELWQPMIWQERRKPDLSYLTAAFQCPLPTALLQAGGHTVGVVASPKEFPFSPLPTLENSRFGVALRTSDDQLSPMIVSPVLGGAHSYMQPNDIHEFTSYLYVSETGLNQSYEQIAREIYQFKDYRKNDIASLNVNFENTVHYALSKYSWFNDAQKGCAYSTDVPGAVKNVSSLDPLAIALVTDNPEMFNRRAYPILEYQLSRDKFLFCADTTQKIQSPSRRMDGPVAPVSEMSSLYIMTNETMPFLLDLSQKMFYTDKIRNLDEVDKGSTWQNALWLYRATHQKRWLDYAIEKADRYLAERVNNMSEEFNDPDGGGFFFWTGYTPRWIDLLELYEETGYARFLEASHLGAKRYAHFVWMAPMIPDSTITVNPGGKAPVYWYLAKKGHTPMYSPEEEAPAWRLSEIGLLPESSGTCSGHRAIFMVNYAPWFLRLSKYTGDSFLRDIAKSAMIGRSRNFPGYHMNTARTTIYEKENYPLHEHKELSVNSFHYNHILPKISSMLDYLVTDAWMRSDGAISFPNSFIEGYAYLQSKCYGFKPGQFYGEQAWLWMPEKLILNNHVELNYISARGKNSVMIALCNQSDKEVRHKLKLNPDKVRWDSSSKPVVTFLGDNPQKSTTLDNGSVEVTIAPHGITSMIIRGVEPIVQIQEQFVSPVDSWATDYFQSDSGQVRAMLLRMGELVKNVYIYLTADDAEYTQIEVDYQGEVYTDHTYPFECTIPVKPQASEFQAHVTARDLQGRIVDLGHITLSKQ